MNATLTPPTHTPVIVSDSARKKPTAFTDPALVRGAIIDSFAKLNPRTQIRNPVMFVVFVGAILTTFACVTDPSSFNIQVTLWLWFTVLFANFAEGRGKAQAATLRKMRTTTMARRLKNDREEKVAAGELRKGDLVVCENGDVIPSDGDVVEGIASVDESAWKTAANFPRRSRKPSKWFPNPVAHRSSSRSSIVCSASCSSRTW